MTTVEDFKIKSGEYPKALVEAAITRLQDLGQQHLWLQPISFPPLNDYIAQLQALVEEFRQSLVPYTDPNLPLFRIWERAMDDSRDTANKYGREEIWQQT